MNHSDFEALIDKAHERKLTLQETHDMLAHARKVNSTVQEIHNLIVYMQKNHYDNYTAFWDAVRYHINRLF